MLDPVRDELQRDQYEREYAIDKAAEFEQYKKAVEMCIVAGFLPKAKFDEALAFVKKFHQ